MSVYLLVETPICDVEELQRHVARETPAVGETHATVFDRGDPIGS